MYKINGINAEIIKRLCDRNNLIIHYNYGKQNCLALITKSMSSFSRFIYDITKIEDELIDFNLLVFLSNVNMITNSDELCYKYCFVFNKYKLNELPLKE